MGNKEIIWILLLFIAVGCNRGELQDVRKHMEENVETAKRIEEMRMQLLLDFRNVTAFYEAMEKKLYVTGIHQNDDDSYQIHYSDGSVIRLTSGIVPLITFGADGEVIVDGKPTGCKPQDGVGSGRVPEISIDDEGYYVVDGVKTILVKGEAGLPGKTPVVSIDAQGYYCLDGVRIVPNISLKGQDGQPGVAPVPTIVWNEVAGKYELRINGQPTEPATYLSPEDGADGEAGDVSDYFITNVTITPDNELVFTFSDGSTQKTSPIKLTDLSFEVHETEVLDIPIGESYRITYSVKTDYVTNPVSVNQMYSLQGWQVLITPPDVETKEGYITVTPLSGLAASGDLMLMTIDVQQRTVVQKITLSVAAYRIVLPENFNTSYVYDVWTPGGVKIAEICREYIQNENRMLTVVYPSNVEGYGYGEGFVPENGGAINHSGIFYKSGTLAPLTEVKLESGKIVTGGGTMITAKVEAQLLTDVEMNKYKVIKIGTQYWMAENLKTQTYNSGQRILLLADVGTDKLGAYCYYDNKVALKPVYGILYNRDAVTCGRLAPDKWYIPDDDEWRTLISFLSSDVGRKIKHTLTGINDENGEWIATGTVGTNLSGFGALPGGYYSGGHYSNIGSETRWWTLSVGVTMKLSLYATLSFEVADAGACYSIRCIKNGKK